MLSTTTLKPQDHSQKPAKPTKNVCLLGSLVLERCLWDHQYLKGLDIYEAITAVLKNKIQNETEHQTNKSQTKTTTKKTSRDFAKLALVTN